MNAADRAALAALADVAARFIQIPYPHINPELPPAEFNVAHDEATRRFTEFQREQAIRLGGHLEWLAREDATPLERRIEMITVIMTRDLGKPLPYPVAPEVQS